MNDNDLIKLNESMIESWNRHDTKKFQTYLDEHIVWRDTGNPEPIKGKEGAGNFLNMWSTAFPDFRIRPLNKVVSGDSIAVEIEFTGTNTGPMKMGDQPEMPATNRNVTNRGCYFAKAKNGRFIEVHTYPDLAGMMVQLGVHEVHA